MNSIINFINTLIKNFYNIFEDFLKFIVTNNLTSLLIITILSLAISGFTLSFKTNIIDYYLNKIFKTTNNNLINVVTSFIQSLLIILFIYLVYTHFIKKLEKKFILTKFNEIEWKNNLLNEIRDINIKLK